VELDNSSLDELLVRFDVGGTRLRDMGGFTSATRDEVLDITDSGRSRLTKAEYLPFDYARRMLAYMVGPEARHHPGIHPHKGWKFLEEANRHLQSDLPENNLPGARRLDAVFKRQHGANIATLASHFANSPHLRGQADSVVAAVANEPGYTYNIAQYLAEQSRKTELDQQRQYGELLAQSKHHAALQLGRLAAQTGLRDPYLIRAQNQLMRTGFNPNNPLLGYDPTPQMAMAAYYTPMTLRLNMKLAELQAAGLDFDLDAPSVMDHEIRHAGVAQQIVTVGDGRIGRGGVEVGHIPGAKMGGELGEGLTEFLRLEDSLTADTLAEATQQRSFPEKICYDNSMLALSGLWHNPRTRTHFNVLFNASYGQADNARHIEQALDAYATIANSQ
jgi:hypothetical protein